MRRDGANSHEKLGLWKFRVQINVPSPIWQVQVLIRRVIAWIRGLPDRIRHVVPLISHIRSYPPYSSHLHPPSVSFSSITLQSTSQNTNFSHPSLSLHVIIMSWHWVQHTPSTASTEYRIHRVQHTPSTAYTEYSIHRVQNIPSTAYTEYSIYPRKCVFPSFSWLRVDYWTQFQLPACLPTPSTAIKQGLHENSKVKSPCHSPTVAS